MIDFNLQILGKSAVLQSINYETSQTSSHQSVMTLLNLTKDVSWLHDHTSGGGINQVTKLYKTLNYDHVTDSQVNVHLHSRDGLKSAVPLSLMVAASRLLKDILRQDQLLLGSDLHISLAEVDGDTLAKFVELIKRGRVESGVSSDVVAHKLEELFRMIQTNIQLNKSHQHQRQSRLFTRGDPRSMEQRSRSVSRLSTNTPASRRSDPGAAGYLSDGEGLSARDPRRRKLAQLSESIPEPVHFSTPRNPLRTPPRFKTRTAPSLGGDNERESRRLGEPVREAPIKAEPVDPDDEDDDRVYEDDNNDDDDVELMSKLRCGFCGQEFKRLTSYTRHTETAHSQPPGLLTPRSSGVSKHKQCPECGAWFSKFGFQRHLMSHSKGGPQNSRTSSNKTKKRFECNICNKHYPTERNLRRHLTTEVHQVKAKIAESRQIKPIKNAKKTAIEKVNNNDKTQYSYQCEECLKVLSEDALKNHQESSGHTRVIPFKLPANMIV